MRAVLRDRRIWLIGVFYLCELTVLYGWAFSAPVILQSLTGLSVGRVGTLIAGMGVLGAAAMLLNARHSDRTGERPLHIALPCLLMAAGFLIGGATRQPLLAVAAFTLTVVAYNAAQGPSLAMPSAFLSGRTSAIGYAVINGIAMVGGFVGPYWMGRARDLTGNYQRGLLTLAIPCATAALLIYLLKVLSPAQKQTLVETGV